MRSGNAFNTGGGESSGGGNDVLRVIPNPADPTTVMILPGDIVSNNPDPEINTLNRRYVVENPITVRPGTPRYNIGGKTGTFIGLNSRSLGSQGSFHDMWVDGGGDDRNAPELALAWVNLPSQGQPITEITEDDIIDLRFDNWYGYDTSGHGTAFRGHQMYAQTARFGSSDIRWGYFSFDVLVSNENGAEPLEPIRLRSSRGQGHPSSQAQNHLWSNQINLTSGAWYHGIIRINRATGIPTAILQRDNIALIRDTQTYDLLTHRGQAKSYASGVMIDSATLTNYFDDPVNFGIFHYNPPFDLSPPSPGDPEDASPRIGGVYCAEDNFAVKTNPGDMSVIVTPGKAWLPVNDVRGVVVVNEEEVTLPVSESGFVALQLDKSTGNASVILVTDEDTPVQNEDYHTVYLAKLDVNESDTEIQPHQISDRRLDETVCGYMRDHLTNLPTQRIYDGWAEWWAVNGTAPLLERTDWRGSTVHGDVEWNDTVSDLLDFTPTHEDAPDELEEGVRVSFEMPQWPEEPLSDPEEPEEAPAVSLSYGSGIYDLNGTPYPWTNALGVVVDPASIHVLSRSTVAGSEPWIPPYVEDQPWRIVPHPTDPTGVMMIPGTQYIDRYMPRSSGSTTTTNSQVWVTGNISIPDPLYLTNISMGSNDFIWIFLRRYLAGGSPLNTWFLQNGSQYGLGHSPTGSNSAYNSDIVPLAIIKRNESGTIGWSNIKDLRYDAWCGLRHASRSGAVNYGSYFGSEDLTLNVGIWSNSNLFGLGSTTGTVQSGSNHLLVVSIGSGGLMVTNQNGSVPLTSGMIQSPLHAPRWGSTYITETTNNNHSPNVLATISRGTGNVTISRYIICRITRSTGACTWRVDTSNTLTRNSTNYDVLVWYFSRTFSNQSKHIVAQFVKTNF
jgi:hypothetical protein